VNTGNAFVRGIEAEVRKKLDFFEFAPWLSHVTLFGNGSLIKSKVEAAKLTNDLVSSTNEHTLTGQPNYIINGGVTISLFKNSFEATMSVNRTGDYINELGTSDLIPLNNGNAVPLVPHFRVKARNMADLVLTQNFLHNKGKIKINVSNLFNKPYILYQDLDGNGKFDEPVVIKKYPGARTFLNYVSGVDNTASSIRPQRTWSLSVSYTF
jgi:outer membrane receptor protein involved in Fe transport